MIPLGKAKLIEHRHATGIEVKSWDLSPWGGPRVFLGAVTQPLPEPGTTVDRGTLRLDTGTGEVWKLEPGDPGPKIGAAGVARRALGLGTLGLAAAAGLLLAGMMGRR